METKEEIVLSNEQMYENALRAKLVYEQATQTLKDTREAERKQVFKLVQQRNSARDLLMDIRTNTQNKKIISKINNFFGD